MSKIGVAVKITQRINTKLPYFFPKYKESNFLISPKNNERIIKTMKPAITASEKDATRNHFNVSIRPHFNAPNAFLKRVIIADF